jgi:lipopolysaccharide/colanic/teichoic acid biosynthesis glycosyltransferase
MTAAASDRAVRAVDVTVAVIGLVLTSPLWPVIAVAIRADSPGPVLFRGERIGRDGVPFSILKFRSMTASAATEGPAITAGGDARVTRVGRVLRRTKLDELPQLLNVLRGDMSIVGPRPEAPAFVARYDSEQRELLRWRPGMTGAASIAYRDEEAVLAAAGDDWEAYYVSTVMPAKARLDIEYCRQRTVLSDLRLIAKTVATVVR